MITTYRRFVAYLKRHYSIFRLPDVVLARLQMQDGLRRDHDQLVDAVIRNAQQSHELAVTVRTQQEAIAELRRRLSHHEQGPLMASAAKLNGARKAGIITLDGP